MALTKILPGALGAGAVDSTAAVATGAIQADDLQAGTVTANKLGAGSVVSGVINTACAIDLNDNIKTRWGTSQDLEIYHDATNSVIDNKTGDLYIKSVSDVFITPGTTEAGVYIRHNGAVELYHDNVKKFETTSEGTKGYGNLRVSGAEGSGVSVIIQADEGDDFADFSRLRKETDGSFAIQNIANTSSWETNIKCNNDGNVELYYDGTKMLETYSNGVKLDQGANSHLWLSDNSHLRCGTGNDLKIYHDGSHSYITNSTGYLHLASSTIEFKNAANNETMLKASQDGAVELYNNNRLCLATQTNGIQVTSADSEANLRIKSLSQDGAAALEFISDNGDDHSDFWRIRSDGGGNALGIQNYADGAWEANFVGRESGGAELYYDNSKKFETHTSGCKVSAGNLYLDRDSAQIIFGNDDDYIMYHNGTDMFLENNTGDFYIRNDGNSSSEHVRIQAKGGENSIVATADGAVDLYCDNQIKFSTISNGVQLHGDSKFKHDGWRGNLDRSWGDYPGIGISPDTTYGNQGEFRFHGDTASNLGFLGGGGDFALNTRTDGTFEEGSDRRRKTNIEEITGALATVKQLTGKKFNIINRSGDLDPNRGTKKQFGLIAQECEDIIPEVVSFHSDENTPNENGWASAYGLDYGQLTPLLINAIKELSAEVETLKTKVAALEAG